MYKNVLLMSALLALISLSSCNPTTQALMPSPVALTAAANSRLVGPLSQALSAALEYAHQAHSPEEAQSLATQRFFSEMSRLLQRQLSQKEVQLQVQAQWSATGKIQIQLQGQISDENITAQAQRQDLFDPHY
jgi:hypothetical protein